jgi:hypothetical protein
VSSSCDWEAVSLAFLYLLELLRIFSKVRPELLQEQKKNFRDTEHVETKINIELNFVAKCKVCPGF